MTAPSRESRLQGGLLGLLIGDALGVPYEFHAAAEIPPAEQIEMTPPAGFRRAHPGVPPGTWSDDGSQALALLSALKENPALDLDDFANKLLDWYARGAYTPDGKVYDVGLQTQHAFQILASGEPPASAGPKGERDNGNGSLMRCLPIILVAASKADAIRLARKQSLVTHGHPRSQLCCALYLVMAWNLLHGMVPAEAVRAAEEEMLDSCTSTTEETELRLVLDGRYEAPQGSGYVVDSLWSAVHCLLSTGSYEACVKRAVALGNDTDTTACIAGGLAGLVYGVEGLPQRWRDALRGQDLIARALGTH